MKKLRYLVKDLEYYSFGFRFGYWPCLKSPYIQIVIFGYRCDFWYGLPSYRYGKKDRPKRPVPVRERQEVQKMLPG
jgi:hypothetical protein